MRRFILGLLASTLFVAPSYADTPISGALGPLLQFSGGKVTPITGPNGVPINNARGLLPFNGVDGNDAFAGMVLLSTMTGSPNVNAGGGFIDGSVNPVATMSHDFHYLPAGALSIAACYAGWFQSPAEFALPNSVFAMSGATPVSGGSGYSVGQIVPMPQSYAYRGAALRVLAVSSGAITKVAIENGGIYYATPLADGTAALSGGATFNFTWRALGAAHVRVGVEPTFGQQVATGANAIVLASAGSDRGSSAVVGNGPGNAQGMSGDADLFVPSGGIACTQPVRVNKQPGSIIGTRNYIAGSQGYYGLVNGLQAAGGSIPGSGGGTSADASASGFLTAVAANSGYFYTPLMLIGRPMKTGVPSVCVVSDSIGRGVIGAASALDPPDPVSGASGWIEKSLGTTYPWVMLGSPGNLFGYMFGSYGHAGLMSAIQKAGCSTVIQEISINDLGGVTNTAAISAAQLLNYEQQFVAELRGIPTVRQIVGMTTTPYTTGKTTQTPKSTGVCTNIQARNADLRNGLQSNGTYAPGSASDYAGLYDVVLDIDSVLESQTTPCTWVNTTIEDDGLHINSVGIPSIVAFAQPLLAAALK